MTSFVFLTQFCLVIFLLYGTFRVIRTFLVEVIAQNGDQNVTMIMTCTSTNEMNENIARNDVVDMVDSMMAMEQIQSSEKFKI